MDGLSNVASGMAVASLAIQLGSGFIKLYEFWGTVQDAPKEVGQIILDLKLLSRTLNELINRKDPSPFIQDVLTICNDKIEVLHSIVRELEPNFSSSKPHIRLWYKFKAAHKREKLKRFRDSLHETKTTLLIALVPQFETTPIYVENIQKEDHEAIENTKNRQVSIPESSATVQIISDLDPPQYSEIENLSSNPIEDKILPATSRFSVRPLPTVISSSALQASVEGALQVAAQNYFKSGAFARAMNDTIQRATTIQTSYRYKQESDHSEPKTKEQNVAVFVDYPTQNHEIIQSASHLRRPSQSRICYQTSATGTLFGTIWVRKTCVRVDSVSDKKVDIVSSFTFFPSSWLTGFGLKYGMEANLCSTPVGWQFNFNPVRAVPEDSPIFKFCKSGDLSAVKQLIADSSASVKDTSPNGLTPLHFAAKAETTNVQLCEFLISEGADKTALAYKGPTDDALSPVTMFAATSKNKPAGHKIEMLRLFEDCIDLSEPISEGWKVLADLVRSFNRENVHQTQNSVNWFLRSLDAQSMVAFGPKTMWHGLQHAVRSFVSLEQENMVVESQLDLKRDCSSAQQISSSRGMAIAYWICLRATGKQLLPMLVAAGAIMHIEGYDYDSNTKADPAILAKQLPFLYTEWSKALTKSIETVYEVMVSELDVVLGAAGWTREALRDLITNAGKQDQRKKEGNQVCCVACGDDYGPLGMGLVEPRCVAFTECTFSKHRFNCACSQFLQTQKSLGRSEQLHQYEVDSRQSHSGDEDDVFYDAESEKVANNQQSDSTDNDWAVGCEQYARELERNMKDPFWEITVLFYRAQARIWLGKYEPGESLCGTCFLQREGYIDEDAKDEKDFLASMPASFYD